MNTESMAATTGAAVTEPGWDAILLAGFGGPEGPDDVMPFLRNVTRGRGIPEERLIEVSHHYQALGGSSPINAQNRALQAALQAELSSRSIDLPVLWGNRNWAPYMADTVRQAHADGHTRLLGLATSAYSCYSSCRQYREDFGLALQSTGLVGKVRIDKLRHYFDHPGFLTPVANAIRRGVVAAREAGIADSEIELVFTTHSIPDAMADSSGAPGVYSAGGAYVAQHLAGSALMAEDIKTTFGFEPHWQLAFQSRSGPPSMPWLEPDVNDVIAGLPALGRRAVIVIPIGFVSDHVEVVWDLDNEAAESAEKAGLFFHRAATPGTDPVFIAGLADLIEERLDPSRPVEALTDLSPTPNPCAPGCCRNLRAAKPTTAGSDSAKDWAGLDVSDEQLAASGIAGTR